MSEPFKTMLEDSRRLIKIHSSGLTPQRINNYDTTRTPRKPVWQMTGEELLFLAQQGLTQPEGAVSETSSAKEERHFVYGLSGLARLFGCSLPTANRIKQSGKIDRAITQVGRKIIVDADLALELAGRKSGGRR